jgi:hypothetical protein
MLEARLWQWEWKVSKVKGRPSGLGNCGQEGKRYEGWLQGSILESGRTPGWVTDMEEWGEKGRWQNMSRHTEYLMSECWKRRQECGGKLWGHDHWPAPVAMHRADYPLACLGVGCCSVSQWEWGHCRVGTCFSSGEATCCLSLSFCLSGTHHGFSLVSVIACVTLQKKSYMENHPSLDSIMFWKTQGQSKWETLCTCWVSNGNHVFWTIRSL